MKMYWRGKDIEEMSRDELIAAVRDLGKQFQFYTSPERSRAFALGSVEMLKRGERQWQA